VPETFLRIGTRTVAVCVFLLLIAGALVTSTQSGLAVPDWPLSYGKVMPPMVGGILYEHGHRLVAAAVTTLVGLELGALLFLLKGRKTVKRLAAAAFIAILLQALLGGLTVLFLLPPAVSSAHAALAEIVFALTATVALMCSRTWKEISSKGEEARRAFRWVALATSAVFFQIVLGAVMRHTGAGLAIPDFPTAFGALFPSFSEISLPGVPIHLAHRLGALAVVLLVLLAAKALSGLEAPLGASSIWSSKAVPLTVAHLAVGALCWVTGVLAAVALAAGFSDKLARD
jgi:heme a synthase